jgi:parallel beta-helix repeat protein
MGVELWSYVSDCVVSNNKILNTYWGISLDLSKNIVVNGNSIRNVSTYGMEAATRCSNVIFSNNVIDNFPLNSGTTTMGATAMVSTNGSSNIKFLNNFARGFSEKILHLYRVNNIDVQGNTLLDAVQCANLQDSNFVNLNNNIIGQQSGSVYNFVFVDYSTYSVTGVSIQNNRFRGTTNNQGMQIYGGASSNELNGFLVKNNFLDQNVWCANGVMWYSNFNTIRNISIEGNFGPTGGAPENTISDYSTAGYGTDNIYAGIQYYKQTDLIVPTGGITGNGA